MNIGHGLGRRLSQGGVLAIAVMISSAGIAAAANAVKGGSYSGTYAGKSSEGITFKVSSNGKKVIDLTVSTPFKCQGGCGGVESPSGGTAKIEKGKFKVTLKLTGPGTSTAVIGTDAVTGTFLENGAAKGTVTSHFKGGSAGETVHWTATS